MQNPPAVVLLHSGWSADTAMIVLLSLCPSVPSYSGGRRGFCTRVNLGVSCTIEVYVQLHSSALPTVLPHSFEFVQESKVGQLVRGMATANTVKRESVNSWS
jgi:hypothetical protein